MGGAALLPAIFLFIYIYRRDRFEKEPMGLILKLIGLGVLTVIGAILLEQFVGIFLDLAFPNENPDYDSFTSTSAMHAYRLCESFIQAALCEEGLKWFFMTIATRKNKNFNSLYDGIVYAVVISLTFAAIENVEYVFMYGFSTAVLRAFTAVPGHTFFAILMGIFYSRWHITELAATLEKRLSENGTIQMRGTPINSKLPMVLSLLVPLLVHGTYDYFAFTGSVLFYPFVIVMYIVSFLLVRKYSQHDEADTLASTRIVRKKYPEYNGIMSQCLEAEASSASERVRIIAAMTTEERYAYGRKAITEAVPNIEGRYRQIAPLLGYDVRSYVVSPSRDIIAAIFFIAGSADGFISPVERNYIEGIAPDGSYMDSLDKLISKVNLMAPNERQGFLQHLLSAATVTAGKDCILSLCYAFCAADGSITAQEMNFLNLFTTAFNGNG